MCHSVVSRFRNAGANLIKLLGAKSFIRLTPGFMASLFPTFWRQIKVRLFLITKVSTKHNGLTFDQKYSYPKWDGVCKHVFRGHSNNT